VCEAWCEVLVTYKEDIVRAELGYMSNLERRDGTRTVDMRQLNGL